MVVHYTKTLIDFSLPRYQLCSDITYAPNQISQEFFNHIRNSGPFSNLRLTIELIRILRYSYPSIPNASNNKVARWLTSGKAACQHTEFSQKGEIVYERGKD